jgi:hypothetical protein
MQSAATAAEPHSWTKANLYFCSISKRVVSGQSDLTSERRRFISLQPAASTRLMLFEHHGMHSSAFQEYEGLMVHSSTPHLQSKRGIC